jgi:hypothetical protein
MKSATATTGHCHCEACSTTTTLLERPRYFARQLLTPVDLTLEQQYFRDRLRRHNRLLHGWGVVCGLAVCRVPETDDGAQGTTAPRHSHGPDNVEAWPSGAEPQPWMLRVTSGYALGPYGDEILVECEKSIDVRTLGSAPGESCGEVADPWCRDVETPRDAGVFYLAVRYREVLSRPVRVQPAGCGCDDTACEYSRWKDGYEFGLLDECPDDHQKPPSIESLFRGPLPDCPECASSPWVVLARVEVEADGTIKSIDNCVCRRMVASLAGAWWKCSGDHCEEGRVKVEGDRRPVPGRNFKLELSGRAFPDGVQVSLGDGVKVTSVEQHATPPELVVSGSVEPNAQKGARRLVVRDSTGHDVLAEVAKAIVVQAVPKPPVDRPTPAPEPAPPRPTRPRPKGPKG